MTLEGDPQLQAEVRTLPDLEGKGYKLLEDLCPTLFSEKCESSTVYSRLVGNIYTGSLYLNLASYLANKPRQLSEVIPTLLEH